jgi:MFS family permease
MADPVHNAAEIPQPGAPAQAPRMFMINISFANWSSIVFAILQSACTAVIAISGLRVAIGLSALAAAAGIHAPARGFHQDAIRIPMMLLAFIGAIINLYVIGKLRRLRNKPAAQWRMQPVSKKKLNSERFQIVLAILTLLLLAAEWITHPMIHRVP